MPERFAVVLPYDRRPILLHCDDGETLLLPSLQGLVDGHIETACTLLEPDLVSADRGVDRIVLVVNGEGKLRRLPQNLLASVVCGRVADRICGDAVLMQVRGDELIGFLRGDAEELLHLL